MDDLDRDLSLIDICVSQAALEAAATYLHDCGWVIFDCLCDDLDQPCDCAAEAMSSLTQAIAIAMKVQTLEVMTDRVVSRGSKVLN